MHHSVHLRKSLHTNGGGDLTMANAKNNRRSNTGRKNVAIKDEHYNAVSGYSELTGVPLAELMDECMAEFIECTIETRLTDLSGQAGSA